MITESQISRRRISKPLGLYLITAFDFIAVGVVQLISVVVVLRREEVEIPFVFVLVLVGLPIMAMGACAWALAGENAGRWALLLLVTVSSVLLILNRAVMLSSGGDSTGGIVSAGWVIRAVFWLAINWWYFNRAHVVAYFAQKSSTVQQSPNV